MNNALSIVTLIVTVLLLSCNSNGGGAEVPQRDAEAVRKLQGTWVSELEGNVVFTVKGDTIYYSDSLSTPVSYYVMQDTLFIENHKVVKYLVRRLDSSNLVFINAEGDEVSLAKSTDDSLAQGEYKGAVTLNQGRKVKNDTVMVSNGTHYHAYTQVNPTTYKVYRQTTNNDGLAVESVYYDNIVYMALYEGQRKVLGQNVAKADFAKLVPQSYLEQAVLSEIVVDGVRGDAVRFVAVLSIPDSYTNYRVNIDVTSDGKKKLSL